jgi:ArsR family transcriptional regulator, arsenate/arsenite/antimonite-responsive transcriptional repressor
LIISKILEIPLAGWPECCHLISMKLEIAARQLESLGSPVRLKIYRALVRAGDEGLACGVLQDKVGLAASTLSHHIRHLREAGLVSQERQGTTLICRTNYPAMNRLVGYLVDECCVEAGCQSAEKAA